MSRLLPIVVLAVVLFIVADGAVLVDEVNAYSHRCRYWSGFRVFEVNPWTTGPCRVITRLGGPYQ